MPIGGWHADASGHRRRAGSGRFREVHEAYEVLSDAMAPRETGSLGNNASKNGVGKTTADKSEADRPSQSTLTPTDLAPSWRGPPARKDGKHAA